MKKEILKRLDSIDKSLQMIARYYQDQMYQKSAGAQQKQALLGRVGSLGNQLNFNRETNAQSSD